MLHKIFAISLLFILCSCESNSTKQEQSISVTSENKPPNVIVILVDDAGYVDFGFMGSEDLKTPNLDALAADGVVFTDAHVTSTVCAPSRAGLITGQYQQRFGFEANHTGDEHTGDIGLAENVTTLAEVFKKNNYKTVAIGKWHLGEKEHNHPNQRGFDEFYGFLAGGRSYFPMKNPSNTHMLQHNGEKVNFDAYLTDVLGEYSVQYTEEHQNHSFFMYLAYNAVHTPMEAKVEDLEKFKNHPRKELAAMTWSLDENVGKLRAKLKALNLLDNTLIYFLSDNGGAHNNQSSSGPLKGWTFNGLTSSLDIFKTSVAAANIQLDNSITLDGENLLPYLIKREKGNPHHVLFWKKLEESAARVGQFKMLSLEGYGSVVYDLDSDIGETTDLSQENEDVYNRLSKQYNNWEAEMMNPLWGEDKSWMEVTFHIHQQLMENEPIYYQSPGEMRAYNLKNMD